LMYQQESGFSLFAQSSLILPLGDSTFYLIVPNATDAVYANWYSTPFVYKAFFDQLFFYKIDMKANNGAGKVVSKEIVLDSVTMIRTMMQAVRHANGTDWWLLKQMYADRGTFNAP